MKKTIAEIKEEYGSLGNQYFQKTYWKNLYTSNGEKIEIIKSKGEVTYKDFYKTIFEMLLKAYDEKFNKDDINEENLDENHKKLNKEIDGKLHTEDSIKEDSKKDKNKYYKINTKREKNILGITGGKTATLDGIYKLLDLYSKVSKEYNTKSFLLEYEFNNDEKGSKREMNNKDSEYVNIESTIEELIKKGRIHQIILTGAPGTGKTYMAKEIAKKILKEQNIEEKDGYKIVQFHPSYDYTDFVEGIRPIGNKNENGNENKNDAMVFKKFDGVFKAFCRDVATLNEKKAKEAEENEKKAKESKVEETKSEETKENKNKKDLYFFIIDEINRADLSKVLGELMLGLEKDKREEPIETQYSNIKTYYDTNEKKDINEEDGVFKNGFFIPENIVIIGTMNDIDRSVESMDFALRRRFTWIEVEVNKPSLKQAFKDKLKFCKHIEKEKDRDIIIDKIDALNEIIEKEGAEYNLNKHYFISQGYFTNIPNIEEAKSVEGLLKWVWKYRIKSLIEEYVRAENSATIDTFIKKCRDAFLIDGE